MKYIREYQVFEASATASALTAEQIDWLDECEDGRWKLNPQTGLVDINGYFDCSEQGLTDLKGVRFGKVSGNFRCRDNELTTLVGAPQEVGRSFLCNDNELTSLVGAPQTVGVSFLCHDNELTTLVGAPQRVGMSFLCERNPVSETTLDSIFALMKKRKSYQQALEQYWPKMSNEDRVLMYKQMPSLSPEDVRKYKALATYNNIKNYL